MEKCTSRISQRTLRPLDFLHGKSVWTRGGDLFRHADMEYKTSTHANTPVLGKKKAAFTVTGFLCYV